MAYVAVHGTGTPLGDPIEVGALAQALGGSKGNSKGGGRICGDGQGAGSRKRRVAVAIGSVKACYGHTEGAAGATGAVNS